MDAELNDGSPLEQESFFHFFFLAAFAAGGRRSAIFFADALQAGRQAGRQAGTETNKRSVKCLFMMKNCRDYAKAREISSAAG